MSEMIPFAVVPLIEESVAKFEARLRETLKFFATDNLVREQSAAYRAEVTELALRAHEAGWWGRKNELIVAGSGMDSPK